MSSSQKGKDNNLDTIDQLAIAVDFLKTLPRFWIVLLVLAIIGSGFNYIRAYITYEPVYTASASFTVTLKREQSLYGSATYYDNAAAEHLAKSFPYILTSSLLHRTVAKDMGEPVTGSINVAVVPNTNLLTLSVTDRDPEKAYRTLNSVFKNYPSISEPIIGKVNMNILDESGVPTTPDNSLTFLRETLMGAGIGLLLGVGWALLVFITNRTVLSEADVKKKLGISCLGSVPKVSKKERSTEVSHYFLITDHKLRDQLQEPFRMIKNKVEYHVQKHHQKVLLITSATASEGKSLFSANLALSLASTGKTVALIDCDLRHPTVRYIFNMSPNVGLGEYLKGEMELADYINSSVAENTLPYKNFLFLPGGASLADGSHLLSQKRMKDLIELVKARCDYVLLDSAPAGLLTDSVVLAKFADAAIIVVRKDVARIDVINDALGHLSESDISIVGGVLNDV